MHGQQLQGMPNTMPQLQVSGGAAMPMGMAMTHINPAGVVPGSSLPGAQHVQRKALVIKNPSTKEAIDLPSHSPAAAAAAGPGLRAPGSAGSSGENSNSA
ncbi:hypothetical protein HaLaN_06002 [Haematococcus lacustris]|uniref:Uncharacterized protein n=1 Tax=Haematococcus lacustris TaxID=44745 RepID=A0A699YMB6_HAELA|nr:hypothetical protein HaLaN_06002 [Haematococcus lacustris]